MAAKARKQEMARMEAAIKMAPENARQMHRLHENERRGHETLDRKAADAEEFVLVMERARLAKEREDYMKNIDIRLADEKKRAEGERNRKQYWDETTHCSWLPSVHSEGEITAFLNSWQEEQAAAQSGMIQEDSCAFTKMYVSRCHFADKKQIATEVVDMTVREGVQVVPTKEYRNKRVDRDLRLAVFAFKLSEEIWKAADLALVTGETEALAKHREHLQKVYTAILKSIDMTYGSVLSNFNDFRDEVDASDMEPFAKIAPASHESTNAYVPTGDTIHPFFKLGLLKKPPAPKGGIPTSLTFHSIGVAIDKALTMMKLPTELGLKDHAMRAVQLSFDPQSVALNEAKGHKHYALDCILIVESIKNPDQVKPVGDSPWQWQQVDAPFRLKKKDYPPKADQNIGQKASSEYEFSLQFEVPEHVSIRSSPLLGKWRPDHGGWELCCQGTVTFESVIKKVQFKDAKDLTMLALIQEKAFDLPYERWALHALNDTDVLYIIEGHSSGGNGDREIHIVARGDKCRLEKPDDKELTYLKGQWLSPATLLRQLSKSGYNFLLNDQDAELFDPNRQLLPKSAELERKCYYDLSIFCTLHAFTSSHHNRYGEDRHCGLFRMSKDQREYESEDAFDIDPNDQAKWHSIRYDKTRCVLSQFVEAEEDATLDSIQGKETHMNLYKLIESEYSKQKGSDYVQDRTVMIDPLLQTCVMQLLTLTRPLSWG